MTLSFNKLKRYFKRTKRKDVGISLARARKNWHAMLLGLTFIVLCGAGAASYEFLHIEGVDAILITDPVETTRYREGDIRKALDKYDALKTKSQSESAEAMPTPVVPTEEVAGEDVPPPVASTADLRVE